MIGAALWGATMASEPVPSRSNRWPVLIVYLVLAVVLVAVLRLAGRGWVGTITAGIVLTGVVGTLVVLLGSRAARR